MATVKDLLVEIRDIIGELEYSYSETIKSYNPNMKQELHEIIKRVDKIIEDVEIDYLESSLKKIKQKFLHSYKKTREVKINYTIRDIFSQIESCLYSCSTGKLEQDNAYKELKWLFEDIMDIKFEEAFYKLHPDYKDFQR
jgi:hypothetical protein